MPPPSWRARAAELGLWLGSWQLSVGLMSLAALYEVFLAIWARASPPHVVRNIAALLPYWLVFGSLLLNTGVCLWRRLGWLRQQVSAGPWLAQGPPEWEQALGPEDIAPVELLARRGYRARPDAGGAWGLRRRWSALGTYLFHGAFGLVAGGFLLTLALRHELTVWVAEGEDYLGLPAQVRSESAPGALALGPVSARFTVRSIRPEFWRDQLLFTRLEAELVLPSGRPATTRINRPLLLGPATFMRLAGFGYAPRYELTDRSGRVLQSAFVKLEVFPPGRRDSFRIEGFPHRFYAEVLPDYAVEGRRPVTRSLNLVRPAVLLRVLRGRTDLGRAVLGPGQSFEFEGLRLTFPEFRYWGEFTIVRDAGAPLLFTGFALALAGLLLKQAGARGEARLERGENGWRLLGWGPQPSLPDGGGRS